MDLASGINGDLVPGANTKARVVSGTKVHDAFPCRGVGLLIEGAKDRETTRDTDLEMGIRSSYVSRFYVHRWSLSSRRNIGTSGG